MTSATTRNTAVRLLAFLLAALAMIGPFTIDTYLPAFPAIRADLGASNAQLQQTLSFYLGTVAVMTLFHGTLSDSFGRKPVILASLAVYTVTAAGCALATTWSSLLLWRAAQGLAAGAGIIVGRAIIRDTQTGADAQRLMSLVTMIFGVAPAVAPIIGGWLLDIAGWRAIFWFLAAYGGLLLLLCWVALPESHAPAARQPLAPAVLWRNYRRLGGDWRLQCLCFAVAGNFSGFFIYIVTAPAVIYDILGLGVHDFPWLFVPGIAGVMIGAAISGRLAGRLAATDCVRLGYTVMATAAVLNLIYCVFLPPALPWTVLPVMAYTVGMAIAMPGLTLLALDLYPQLRGMTASLQGFMHSLIAGLAAGVVSPFVAGSALALALSMAGFLLLGWTAWFFYRSRSQVIHE